MKVRFCREAVDSRDRFQRTLVLDDDLAEAVQWVSTHTAAAVCVTAFAACV